MIIATLSGGVMHVVRWIVVFLIFATRSAVASADELLYAYEADVAPYDSTADWLHYDPCETPPCGEELSDGHFDLMFDHPPPGDIVNYHHWIAQPPADPPSSLWVEWQYRSNHPLGPNFYTCDGRFSVTYGNIHDSIFCYGDAAVSFSGDDFVVGLDLESLHTFRFESLDGVHYSFSVDGLLFLVGSDLIGPEPFHYLQFGSRAASCHDWPDLLYVRNEWDFVRYGTIGFGERIVAADPPMGFLNQSDHANLDRFTVTYDSPNYAYIDDITVNVTCATAPNCPEAPQVIATKRLDNGPSEVLEIVLDRPLPPNARTVFTFTDVDPTDPNEPTINTVSYTFQLGDVDADGDWDMHDFASAQNCFQCGACLSEPEMRCRTFDFVLEIDLVRIKLDDLAAFVGILTGPEL